MESSPSLSLLRDEAERQMAHTATCHRHCLLFPGGQPTLLLHFPHCAQVGSSLLPPPPQSPCSQAFSSKTGSNAPCCLCRTRPNTQKGTSIFSLVFTSHSHSFLFLSKTMTCHLYIYIWNGRWWLRIP